MADDVEDKKRHKIGKLLSSGGWRTKSSDKTTSDVTNVSEPPPQALSDDVVDFLRPSTTRAKPNLPKAPKIDIAAAQRYAENAASSAAGNGLVTPSSLRGKSRKPRRQGLLLRFSDAPPEIMGCGGEEEDTPPLEIGRRRRMRQDLPNLHAHPPPGRQPLPGSALVGDRPSQGHGPSAAELQHYMGTLRLHQTEGQASSYMRESPSMAPAGRLGSEHDDDSFVPKPIRRAPTGRVNSMSQEDPADAPFTPEPIRRVSTGWSGHQPEESSPEQSTPGSAEQMKKEHRLSYHLPELETLKAGAGFNSDAFLPASPRDARSFSAQLIHKMRSDEGNALHRGSRLLDGNGESPAEPEQSTLDDGANSRRQVHPPKPAEMSLRVRQGEHGRPPPRNQAGLVVPLPSPTRLSPQLPYPSPLLNSSQPSPTITPQNAMPFLKPISSPRFDSSQDAHAYDGGRRPSESPARRPVSQGLSQSECPNYFAGPDRRGSEAPDLPPLRIPPNNRPRGSSNAGADRPVRTASDAKTPGTAVSLRTAASAQSTASFSASAANQSALEDFADRCSHMGGVFRLQAEFDKPISSYQPVEWVRAASWWFIRARAGLEAMMRSVPRSRDGTPAVRSAEGPLQQPHVDLAKCHWIVTEVLAGHPNLPPSSDSSFGYRAASARDAGDVRLADLFESADLILAHLRGLSGSMARNNVMPPSHALIQGQDQSIWVKYPDLPKGLINMQGRESYFDPLAVMALAETKNDFVYNRIYADVKFGGKGLAEPIVINCLVSLMRGRNDWQPKLCICTQRDLITIVVTRDREQGPSWHDVQWSERDRLLRVNLAVGLCADIQFEANDFRQLYTMYNHSFEVQSSLMPAEDEKLVFEDQLREFQFIDTRRTLIFPPDRIQRCRVKVFAKYHVQHAANNIYHNNAGFRMVVVTSPKNKMLGVVSHEIGEAYPIFVSMFEENGPGSGIPVLNLQVIEEDRKCQFYMVFNSSNEQKALYRTLNSMDCVGSERALCHFRLKGLAVEHCGISQPNNLTSQCQWQDVSVIAGEPWEQSSDNGRSNLPPELRIVAAANDVAIVDRLSLGPSKLRLRVPVNGDESLSILRSPQSDFILTLQTNRSRIATEDATELIETVHKSYTSRTFTFFTAVNLHAFQEAISGHKVLFDGLVSGFTISRKRAGSGLSFHRSKLDAGISRIQITSSQNRQGQTTQLVAFFEDFKEADSLSLTLSSADTIESVDLKGERNGRGRFGVRLVDAKFSLPLPISSTSKDLKAMIKRAKSGIEIGEDDEDGSREEAAVVAAAKRRFVCLEAPEEATECDDITLGFDAEKDREQFLSTLPAEAQAGAAMRSSVSLRRRKDDG